MGRKSKYSQKIKLRIIEEYLEGNGSSIALARKYGCNDDSILVWVSKYRACGEIAFRETHNNQSYSKEFKWKVAEEYLAGGISLSTAANKYNLRSKTHVEIVVLLERK